MWGGGGEVEWGEAGLGWGALIVYLNFGTLQRELAASRSNAVGIQQQPAILTRPATRYDSS